MKDVKALVEGIVYERNDIIARLAIWQGVDLTTSNYDSFKPDADIQELALEELTELAMHLEDEYESFSLPEIHHYCKERYKFSEHWSGILKDDALRLLGLDSSPDVDLLFKGVE